MKATEWREWGKRDPLWAVSSWKGKAAGQSGAWTPEDFYRVGREDWEGFRKSWEQYGLDKSSVVEIGCGSGRITRCLQDDFKLTVGIDVSPEQIENARKAAPRARFYQVSEPAIPQSIVPGYGAVFSTHVLQHVDSPGMVVSYVRESYRALMPGGTIMLHIPLCSWPFAPQWLDKLYVLRNAINNVRAGASRTLANFGWWTRFMQYRTYSAEWILATAEQVGFQDAEIRIVRARSNGHPHPFLMGRKPIALGSPR